jgi:NADH-quinone oxidoreductase subunit J
VLADILFYLFSFVLLTSSFVVVGTRNTIYSVLFLILAFFNAAGLFILLGAEFLAMLLIVVYVGAIAVLFLFVVMMLNVDNDEVQKIKTKFNKYSFIAFFIGTVLFIEISLIIQPSTMLFDNKTAKSLEIAKDVSNSEAIGNVLYTDFIFPFQLSGMILFVAMIGAIVLTLRDQTRFIRKQNIGQQVARTRSDSVKLEKVESGKGIDI